MHLIFSPKRIARILTIVAIAFSLASLIGQFCRYMLNWGRNDLIDFINVDYEKNSPALFAALQLLFIAVLLAAIAADVGTRLRYRRHWQGLSIIFLYLTFDEWFSIHEHINRPLDRTVQNLFGSPVDIVNSLFVPIFLLIYLRFWLNLPKQLKLQFFWSVFLYICGALLIELIGFRYFSYIYHQPRFAAEIITTLEELLEMVGLNIFIYALLSHIVTLSVNKISVEIIVDSTTPILPR